MPPYSFRLVLVIFLFAGLFTGCSEEENPAAPQAPPEIMPLQPGNAWTYQLTNYDASGAVRSSAEMTAFILGDTLIDGELWSEYGPVYPGSEFFMNRTDGLWYRQRNVSLPGLMAKYPASPGNVFTEGHGDTVRVLSVERDVTVPAGLFRCHEYEQRSELIVGDTIRFRYRRCFSPGVGMVLLEQYIQYGDDPEYLLHTATLTAFVPEQ
ncbi:MAG: hypothetical protein JXA28_03955 [Bacteroidetes bacterium]|nr:hypothetical protein [Bacteroidota bacterium]